MPVMKKYFPILFILLLVCGCTPAIGSKVSTSGTATPFIPLSSGQITGAQLSDPENVVQAFLTDAQEAPAQVNSYLSQAMQSRYPGLDVIKSLDLPGDINGFGIRSVEANTKIPTAYVRVGLNSQGEEIGFRFTLVMENSKWVIDAIERVTLQ